MAAIPPKSTTTEEEGLGRRLWIKSKGESVFAIYTPFTVCLASGNLKLETFRHYIAQDVYFLKAFPQAYEMAEECADDDDAKLSISELRKSVLEELKMHDSFVQSTTKMVAAIRVRCVWIGQNGLLSTADESAAKGLIILPLHLEHSWWIFLPSQYQ